MNEKKIKQLLASQSTKRLVDLFEASDEVKDEDVYTVRGWLLDELEIRDKEAFESFLDSNEISPRKFFLKD
jgi:hypothetical protein